jgi:hypothetical protein
MDRRNFAGTAAVAVSPGWQSSVSESVAKPLPRPLPEAGRGENLDL